MAKERNTVRVGEGIKELRQEALEKANPALQAKIGWIAKWQADEVGRSILGRWDLGEEIDEVWTDLKDGGKKFGNNSKATIALFMNEDPSIVNMAHALYCAYSDRKLLQAITEMKMQDQVTHLSYSHMRRLLAIKDPQTRHELMNKCLEECWTSAELGEEVQRLNGGVQSNNPNGRASVPKDAQTVIGQMIDYAEDFQARNLKVWKDPRHSVVAQVDKLKPVEYTEDLAKKLGELAHRMRQLANEANARADEAERKYEDVSRVLKMGPAAKMLAADLPGARDTDAEAVTRHTRGNRPAGRRVKVG